MSTAAIHNPIVPDEPRLLRLDPADNIVVAIDRLPIGQSAFGVTAVNNIPRGHKMAVAPIPVGTPIRKFGNVIGIAKAPIMPGEGVHEHNVAVAGLTAEHEFGTDRIEITATQPAATFQGYRRASGRTGTRNYVGILTSVNCSASVARFAAAEIERSGRLARFPGIDGVVPIVHGTGCGMASRGE